MKKSVLVFLLVVGSFLGGSSVFAADWLADTNAPAPAAKTSGSTIVTVTEKIPGAGCKFKSTKGPDGVEYKEENAPVERRLYECTIEPGFGSVINMFGAMIRYTTYIVALIGVLMLVGFGIAYMLPTGDQKAKEEAKKHIMELLGGLILLYLMGFILNTVAPWIYQ